MPCRRIAISEMLLRTGGEVESVNPPTKAHQLTESRRLIMYKVDLSANVPLFGQEMCYWCGAASAQMTRDGYPDPANRLYYTQTYLWNVIQAHNSTLPADQGWATDPNGLNGCLQSLSSAPVDWVPYPKPSAADVMFFMLYWMNIEQYPSPVLVNQGGHWVVVVEWETDVEPVGGSTPTLLQIRFHDPEPHNVGTDTTMSGAQWYAGPWNGAVIYSGSWFNQYVAIVEPPVPKGEVKIATVNRLGDKLLTPEQAMEFAGRWIEERRLHEKPQYRLLRHADVQSHSPLLVREHTAQPVRGEPPKMTERVPHYYIVPFGLKGELGPQGSPLVRICVLVNAYSGAFEEVTTFGKPLHYLSQQEALNAVAAALRVDRQELKHAKATLMFQPGEITHVRTYPFWAVEYNNRFLYVDQLGRIYTHLLPSIPGD